MIRGCGIVVIGGQLPRGFVLPDLPNFPADVANLDCKPRAGSMDNPHLAVLPFLPKKETLQPPYVPFVILAEQKFNAFLY